MLAALVLIPSGSASVPYWSHLDSPFACNNQASTKRLPQLGCQLYDVPHPERDYFFWIRPDAVSIASTYTQEFFTQRHPIRSHWQWRKPQRWVHTEGNVRCQGGTVGGGLKAVFCGRADGVGYRVLLTRCHVAAQTRIHQTVYTIWVAGQPSCPERGGD